MTDVICWICHDGRMIIDLDTGDTLDGLPVCRCETCGAIASSRTVARHSYYQRLKIHSNVHVTPITEQDLADRWG